MVNNYGSDAMSCERFQSNVKKCFSNVNTQSPDADVREKVCDKLDKIKVAVGVDGARKRFTENKNDYAEFFHLKISKEANESRSTLETTVELKLAAYMGILFSCVCLHEIIFSLKMLQNLHHAAAKVQEPKAMNATVQEPKAMNATVQEPKAVIATVQEPKAMNATVQEPKAMNATVQEPKAMNATVQEPKAMNATVQEPKAMNATVQEPKAMNVTVQEPKAHTRHSCSEATLGIDKSTLERHRKSVMGNSIEMVHSIIPNSALMYIETKMRTFGKRKTSSVQSTFFSFLADWFVAVGLLVLFFTSVLAKRYGYAVQEWKPYVKKQKIQEVCQKMKGIKGQPVSLDRRKRGQHPLSCTSSGRKSCSPVVLLLFVSCLCFSSTSAASDEPGIVQLNVTVNEPFSLSCHVPDNGAFRWKRFLKLQNGRENLYDSKDKRFLKNDTNFTAFSNGTIMFQCANLSDTGEYHCVVEEGTSNLIETKYYVHVQISSANFAKVKPEENPDSKSPAGIGPAVGGGVGVLIFCLVIGSLVIVCYLHKRNTRRGLALGNNNQEGNDGELKENDVTEPLRNVESAKILNCTEATRQSNETAESPMNGGVSNGLSMVSEGTMQSSGTTEPLMQNGGQHCSV